MLKISSAIWALIVALAMMPTVRASGEMKFEMELCDFKVPAEIMGANASFSVIFTAVVGKDGHVVRVEKVKNDFLSDEPFVNCLKSWVLPAKNKRFTVVMNWKHGVGWTGISISGLKYVTRIKICPGAFRQYEATSGS